MTKRTDSTAKTNNTQGNPFVGCRIVATGKLKNFTRNDINSKIASIGGIAGSSVTSKTNYLICCLCVHLREKVVFYKIIG